MKKNIHTPARFKDYNQHQLTFLPASLDELIPAEHPVRVVNRIVDEVDVGPLVSSYEGGGTSSYHPVMLLKVLLYGYLRNIYSTRRMEEALHENIHFMWLAGQNRPDHNTLARFRSKRLKKSIEHIFAQTVHLLVESGLLSLKESFLDGTKVEANANKYTFVWGKAITYNRKRMEKQLNELISYADRVAQSEEDLPSVSFEEINPEKIRETIDCINKKLKDHDVDPKVRQKLRYGSKRWPETLERYGRDEETLGQRNSFSRTDTDATFMRMKDDHMRNGQLKAGYNLQVSTENQFVTNVSVHPNPTDSNTLKGHLESFQERHGKLPENLTADAGYGSHENYSYLEDKGIEAYVKYPGLHREEKGKSSPYHPDNWKYDAEEDTFTCPAGKKLHHLDRLKTRTRTGFMHDTDLYRATGCLKCRLRGNCYTGKANRTITINHKLRRQKERARQLLYSYEGRQRRKRRCWEVETFFADFKQNRLFRRFNLRGMANVLTESLMLAMTYNMRKLAAV